MIDYESLNFFFELKLKKLNYEKKNLYQNLNIILDQIKNAIKINDNSIIPIYSKKLSEILDLLRIYELLKIQNLNYFYFPVNICFRGRAYFLSSTSFTFYKEFRYCLYSDIYENNFMLPFHPLNKKIEDTLDIYLHKLKTIKNFNFINKNKNIQYAVL
jgi:hypothetical protein